MNSFFDHVPEEITRENPNVQNFLRLLDGMQTIRKDEIDYYVRNLMYPLVYDIRIMRRYVDEWKAEYTEQSTEMCIDCLYRSYYDIYNKKGTYPGLQSLLRCLFAVTEYPEVDVVAFSQGLPIILFDDLRPNDWLPEGADIAAEINVEPGDELWCPTLLDDTWAYCAANLEVNIANLNYVPSEEFLTFIRTVIIKYLPMVRPDLINIEINIV